MTLLARALDELESGSRDQSVVEDLRAAVERQDEILKRIAILSSGQMDVARLLARGYSNREASELLGLDERTVASVKTRIRTKLGIDNDAQLIHALHQAEIVVDCDV